jgi:hypothetical protein
MTNYIDAEIADLGEPPDWPEMDYGDADISDEAPDFGEPPDFFPVNFVPSEPPDLDDPADNYAPPGYLIGIPDSTLNMAFDSAGHENWPIEAPELEMPAMSSIEPSPGQMALDGFLAEDGVATASEQRMVALGYDLDQLDRDNPYFHLEPEEIEPDLEWEPEPGSFTPEPDLSAIAPTGEAIWEHYYAAVIAGQNIGGSEENLIARANEMNLVDARFLGYSDESGHHVGAIELAVDPATGQEYGQTLNVASFADVEQAATLYNELQGHVFDNSLPNYAIADLASHAALEHGNPLNWQFASEQDLALYNQLQAVEISTDEPPEPLMNDLLKEYAGVDLPMDANEGAFQYDPKPEQLVLNYGIDIESEREGKSYLGIVKEWDGGPRHGGGEEYRLIGVYDDRQTAESIAQDLWNLQQDVQELTGDAVLGWQAMGSMAYEIGVANDAIQQGEPLFAHPIPNAPSDPFEIQPTEVLFAQYENIQQEQTAEVEKAELQPDDATLIPHEIDF